jgi:hypothetical protein
MRVGDVGEGHVDVVDHRDDRRLEFTSASRSAGARRPASSGWSGNGAETGSGSARLAPRPSAPRRPASTPALLPAITVCFGSLKLAASTTSPLGGAARTACRTASASRPRMAAIAPCPTGTASCMAWARRRTSGRASASVSAPAATSALYSPSEWPATASRQAPALGQPGAVAGDARRQHHRLRVGGEVQLFLRASWISAGDVLAERRRGLLAACRARPGDRPRRRACRRPASPGRERRTQRSSAHVSRLWLRSRAAPRPR